MPTTTLATFIKNRLPSLANRLLEDETLCLCAGRMRKNEETSRIYYRGAKVLGLYLKDQSSLRWEAINPGHLPDESVAGQVKAIVQTGSGDIDGLMNYVKLFPTIKDALDRVGKLPWEREVQQMIMRVNNRCPQLGHGNANVDVLLTDMEYVQPSKPGDCDRSDYRFDLVGVEWPSTGADRKVTKRRRQVLAELKCGYGVVDGTAGIVKHLEAFARFVQNTKAREELAQDTVRSYHALHHLGLISTKHAVESIDVDGPPLCLLLLADIDPATSKLAEAMRAAAPIITQMEKDRLCELKYARCQHMGYGIYQTRPITDLFT